MSCRGRDKVNDVGFAFRSSVRLELFLFRRFVEGIRMLVKCLFRSNKLSSRAVK